MSAGNATQLPEPHKNPISGARWRRALQIIAGLVAAYLVGFIVFVERIDHTDLAPANAATSADAIVALTGGPERIEAAFQLLKQQKGQRLLISGVHPEVTKDTLNTLLGNAGGQLDCCVDLDREAENTIGNAAQAAAWARHHGYRSIIIVTSSYHLPRALLELRRAMPEAELIAHPVFQDTVHLQGWWVYPGTTRLLIAEYTKYLLALAHGASRSA